MSDDGDNGNSSSADSTETEPKEPNEESVNEELTETKTDDLPVHDATDEMLKGEPFDMDKAFEKLREKDPEAFETTLHAWCEKSEEQLVE